MYDGGPIPSATDSALQAARGGADRATLRLSSVAQLGQTGNASSTLTLSAEHAALREESAWTLSPAGHTPITPNEQRSLVRWQSNTGLVGQLNTRVANTLFLTTGLRIERNDALGENDRVATLPMLGLATVRDFSGATVKLRSAYGKGIRAPQTPSRTFVSLGSGQLSPTAALSPEQQSGVEAGADVFVGRRWAFHLTRFDQEATGLIQQVVVPDTTAGMTGGPRRFSYDLQNVGEIENRGWELQSATTAGALTVTGTFSLVDSRVMQLARGYSGDLRPGDRVIETEVRAEVARQSRAARQA